MRLGTRITLILLLLPVATIRPAEAVPLVLFSIPSVREREFRAEQFGYGTASRVVVDPAYAASLTDDAHTLAEDIAALLETTAPAVVTGAGQPGDIVLALGAADDQLGTEGYRLDVGNTVRIAANTDTGVFRGSRTVLQWLRQTTVLPGVAVRDWPSYPVRATLSTAGHLSGLKRWWWENHIRELSYLKFNETHVYIDGLSDDDIRHLDAFAAKYHIKLVGQRNMPGHMHSALPPQYRIGDAGLDITNQAARDWAKGLVESKIDLFRSSDVWHMGGDEYPEWPGPLGSTRENSRYPALWDYARNRYGPNANAWDTFQGFANEVNATVRSHGKSMRMWNDMIRTPANTVPVDTDVTVEYWYSDFNREQNPGLVQPRSAAELARRGYKLVNSNWDYMYYCGGFRPDGSRVCGSEPRTTYEEFHLGKFHGSTLAPDDPAIQGLRLAQWNDGPPNRPEGDDAMAYGLFERLRATAQVAWGTPKHYPTWDEFKGLVTRLSRAPGYRPEPRLPAGNGPGVSPDAFEKLTFFASRTDGRIEHGWQPRPGHGPWERASIGAGLGGGSVGNPSAVIDPNGRLAYFVRTRNGTIEHGWQPAAGTGPWQEFGELGSEIAGDPSALRDATGRLVFFARRTDGRILFGRQAIPGCGPWVSSILDRTITGTPAPVLDSAGRLAFFARTPAGRVLYAVLQSDGTWSFTETGQGVAGDIATALDANGTLTYFARTTGGQILHGWLWQGTWNETVMGGDVAGDPAVILDPQGQLGWFARRGDGTILHGWQQNPVSGPWVVTDVLGTGIVGDPSVALDVDGKVVFFARKANGRLLHGWQTKPGEGPWAYAEVGEGIAG